MAAHFYLQLDGDKGLKFSKVKRKYTQQEIGGGSSGNTAGGWDPASNRIA
jgi:type VI secretion system secreted protein Hcp